LELSGEFEGDAVTQRGELADVVADLAGGVGAGGVVVGVPGRGIVRLGPRVGARRS